MFGRVSQCSQLVAPRTLHVPNKLPLVEDPLRESGRAELEHPAAQSQMCQESKRLGLKLEGSVVDLRMPHPASCRRRRILCGRVVSPRRRNWSIRRCSPERPRSLDALRLKLEVGCTTLPLASVGGSFAGEWSVQEDKAGASGCAVPDVPGV